VIANGVDDMLVFSVEVAMTLPVPVFVDEKTPAVVTDPTDPVASENVTFPVLVVPSL